ncbi:hypothetical protein TanjilG_33007 [Lupinus angustifolius]|uniref:Uncharacterized protein n=1 Tax=Lupinus angustifolius TaxID=3871 RepID=A0A4P1RN75_LUPAN|nr:hypothetical protein TanjilG_33007 [Lupinus angustifolius]
MKEKYRIENQTVMNYEGRLGGRSVILAGKGRPVPVPPQLLQTMRPEPEHVLQPKSRSDQREQKQVTRPVPLQVGQRMNEPAMGLLSINDFTITAPARTVRPVANWVRTIGPMRIEEREWLDMRLWLKMC